MFQIKTKHTNSLKPSNWLRIGDLSNFEGPVLTLFQDLETNHLFLYDWVDRDKTHNRWMIYTVHADKLNQFLNKEISHFDLFQERPTQEVYVSDIDNRGMNFSQYPILELMEVPEEYVPSRENYFEEGDCVGEERIRLVVSREISRSESIAMQSVVQYNSISIHEIVNLEDFPIAVVSGTVNLNHSRNKYNIALEQAKGKKKFNKIKQTGFVFTSRNSDKSTVIKSKAYANRID